jgi:3-oxo-5alpha-steroid 4-dehydrogenase
MQEEDSMAPAPPTHWDEETDVVVVGFGGAGAAAAIEAAAGGARVVVLERYQGGGATYRCGGVIYTGGGTPQQRAADFDDDSEQMYRYLRQETGDAVDEVTLRSFCEASRENQRWLQAQGVEFAREFYPKKAAVPPDPYGLYFSGNERQRALHAEPAPRGHRVAGNGMTGRVLFERLRQSALQQGVDVRQHSRPLRLIMDDGRVVGVEVLALPSRPTLRRRQRAWTVCAELLGMARRGMPRWLRRRLAAFELRHGRRYRLCARGGVVLCAGGFAFNPEMVSHYAPLYQAAMPLGTPGDDGSGIRLGLSAGAAVREMEQCAASRFIAPPEALMAGVLVDGEGRRLCDETLYASTLSRYIAARGGRARLVIDAGIWRRARRQIAESEKLRFRPLGGLLSGAQSHVLVARGFGLGNLTLNRRRARTLAQLAARCGVPATELEETVARYNKAARQGDPDELGKAPEYVAELSEPPFYAIRCDLDSWLFPATSLTLGGLDVDGLTQQVRRRDGSSIPGLYAAGRNAVGVCSRSYLSGLSVADCVFAGRNAGRSAAALATW